MKRSPMPERKASLKRTTALPAGPLARSSLHANQFGRHKPTRRPRDTGPTKAVVIAVLERDGYCCFRCGGALWGDRGYAYSLQHRRARGVGGSRRADTNQPQNLIAVCGSATSPGGCHLAIESHRTEARDSGWAIRQSEDPLQIPVQHWQYGLIFLYADGGFGSRPASQSTAEEA